MKESRANSQTAQQILSLLSEHPDKPMMAFEIARELGIKNTEPIRHAVNLLRYLGKPVCSWDEGYMFSEKKENIIRTINGMKSRMRSMQEAVDGLEGILRGQGR